MENTLYDYSAIINRKPFMLPEKARVGVWIAINVEHFDIGLPVPTPAGKGSTIPDMRAYASRDYGNRVGIWRIIEVLDKHKIKATIDINADICEHYPVIIEECKKRNWEFMCHANTNSQFLGGLNETDERQIIARSIATIEKATGERPKGWRSPGFSSTFHTPDFLAEEGIRYMSDWSNDDQPYPINVNKGNLICLPTDAVDDLSFRDMYSAHYFETLKDHFDTLYRDGAVQARIFGFGFHPFDLGRPHRIGVLDKILQYMKSYKNVWFATGWEIASWYYKEYLGIKV
jgi:allantoinase